MKTTLLSLSAIITIISGAALRADTIYVAEEQLMRVSIVQTNGVIQPFADNVGLVLGLALDSKGNLYAAGAGNDTIYQVAPSGAVSVLAAGSMLGSPAGMVCDTADNLFTSGYGWSGTVNRITPNGTVTRLITGTGGYGLAFDANGNLYVADSDRVIKVTPSGETSTFASGFGLTWGLAFDSQGNLFVADYSGNSISKITPNGEVSLFAAGLQLPTGLAFDSHGDLYVCNLAQHYPEGYLSRITPDGTVSTFATGLNFPAAIAIKLEAPVVNTNHPPVAQCTNVTVSADDNCQGFALVDNGSFDPDGDPITLTQTPPGPYPLGTTQVLLTVTDTNGASDSCTATVTVLDTTPPAIMSASASPAVLWPPNHQMVQVNVSAAVTDNCGSATWKIVRVQSNEAVNAHGSGKTAPDWTITGNHTLKLRAERTGMGSSRFYTITLQATDSSGNRSALKTVTVTVPKDQGKAKH